LSVEEAGVEISTTGTHLRVVFGVEKENTLITLTATPKKSIHSIQR